MNGDGEDDPKGPLASPVCWMDEAPDSYMGFATPDEILQAMAELTTAKPEDAARIMRAILPRIRDDRLHADLREKLRRIEAGR